LETYPTEMLNSEYNTIQIYTAPKVACKSDALFGSEACYVT